MYKDIIDSLPKTVRLINPGTDERFVKNKETKGWLIVFCYVEIKEWFY